MNNINNITFFLFTYNEERRVENMIRCLQGHGEIVLVDNFSTDQTLDIANRYSLKVLQHKNIGYVENETTMAFIESVCETEWMYLAYADEIIPLELMKILKEIAASNKYSVVKIYRKNYMFGVEVYNYGKHHLRMFKKGTIDFTNNIVHKLGKIKVPKKQVINVDKGNNTSIHHFSLYNMERLELVHSRYAGIESTQKSLILNQKFSGVRALYKLFSYFFGTYLYYGGFRAGWVGLFISIQIAYYKFSIEARIYEIDNNINLNSMENAYSKIVEQILLKRSKNEIFLK